MGALRQTLIPLISASLGLAATLLGGQYWHSAATKTDREVAALFEELEPAEQRQILERGMALQEQWKVDPQSFERINTIHQQVEKDALNGDRQ